MTTATPPLQKKKPQTKPNNLKNHTKSNEINQITGFIKENTRAVVISTKWAREVTYLWSHMKGKQLKVCRTGNMTKNMSENMSNLPYGQTARHFQWHGYCCIIPHISDYGLTTRFHCSKRKIETCSRLIHFKELFLISLAKFRTFDLEKSFIWCALIFIK